MSRTIVICAAAALLGCADGHAKSSGRDGSTTITQASNGSETTQTVVRRVLAKPAGFHISPMPDGQRILLVLDSTGDLAMQDLRTGDLRLITHNTKPWDPGYAYYPRISRDGNRIAYAWNDNQTGLTSLRVIDVAGGEPQTIAPASEAVPYIEPDGWSGDGRWILATRAGEDHATQIVLVPADSGRARVIKTLDWRWPDTPSLSPDGRFIAYSFSPSDDSNDADIYILPIEGGRETRVVEGRADDRLLGWFPDGKHLLYTSDRNGAPAAWSLGIVNGKREGSSPVLVKPELWRASASGFTADGAFFYNVTTGGRHVYVTGLDSSGRVAGTPSPITTAPLIKYTFLDWSPDGRSIAYQVHNERTAPIIIAIRSMQSGETRQLVLPARVQYIFQMRWLRDGSGILIRGQDKGVSGLLRLDVRTGKVDEILGHGVTPFDLTADGKSMLYRAYQSKEAKILVRDLATGTERELHRHPGLMTNWWSLAASSDGAQLAFFRWVADDRHELMTMPVAGGEPRRIAVLDGERVSALAWSADGRTIFAAKPDAKGDTARVWRVPAAGGTPSQAGLAMEGLTTIRLSPDGRQLAFAAGIGRSELWVMERIPRR